MIDGYAPATAVDLALENDRLRAELRARQAGLRACRRHVSDAIDAERRRIERDALEELSARAALPVRLDVLLDHRLAADVEAAGYFLVNESLTKGPLAASGTRQDSGYPAGRTIPGLIDSRASGAPVCEALESQ
jgi:hypothetical protein